MNEAKGIKHYNQQQDKYDHAILVSIIYSRTVD